MVSRTGNNMNLPLTTFQFYFSLGIFIEIMAAIGFLLDAIANNSSISDVVEKSYPLIVNYTYMAWPLHQHSYRWVGERIGEISDKDSIVLPLRYNHIANHARYMSGDSYSDCMDICDSIEACSSFYHHMLLPHMCVMSKSHPDIVKNEYYPTFLTAFEHNINETPYDSLNELNPAFLGEYQPVTWAKTRKKYT